MNICKTEKDKGQARHRGESVDEGTAALQGTPQGSIHDVYMEKSYNHIWMCTSGDSGAGGDEERA